MNKILVTGASGFIGRALTTRLRSNGWDVLPMNSADGDIARNDTMAKFAQHDVAHVFHLASKTFVPDSWGDPQAFCQTNVLGTVNVLEFCRLKEAPMTFVSAYVYGHPDSLPIREDSAIRPSNPYALTKRLAEGACEFYAGTYGLPVTAIRLFNAYGIDQPASFLIPMIVRQALGSGNSIIVNALAPRRDYVYLDDVVAALMATMDKPGGYRVYNIGSGFSLSVKEVIDVVQASAGTQKEVISKNVARTNEIMDVVADISNAGKELEWHPGFSFHAGIETVIHAERSRMAL